MKKKGRRIRALGSGIQAPALVCNSMRVLPLVICIFVFSNLHTTTLILTAHRISHININLTSHSVQVKKQPTHCVEYSQQIQHARNRRHGRTVHFLFCCSIAFIKLRRRNLHAHQKRPQNNRSSIVQPQATGSALCNKTPDELKRRK